MLVPAMITLSAKSDKSLRVQVAETVSIIARYDFPERWDGLITVRLPLNLMYGNTDLIRIQELVGALKPSPQSYATNLSVLETAHSIFGRWRSEMRSNELFTTINFVLSQFVEPFLQVLRYTSSLLLDQPLSTRSKEEVETIAQSMVVLINLYNDLTCQDIAPTLEDGHNEFFGGEKGLFTRFLSWDPPQLQTDADEPQASVPTQIKTAIFELAESYIHRYPELLQESQSVEYYVRALWALLGGGQRSGIAYDNLVSQSLRFLGSAIRSGSYRGIFESRDTISGLVEGVVVPNVTLRDHEVEQFEDDPLEYVRIDLTFASASAGSVSGGLTAEGTTRRQAAADVLRALISSGFEADTTEIVLGWIGRGLQTYADNPRAENTWKKKDESVYLLTAIATRGATAQVCRSSTSSCVLILIPH